MHTILAGLRQSAEQSNVCSACFQLVSCDVHLDLIVVPMSGAAEDFLGLGRHCSILTTHIMVEYRYSSTYMYCLACSHKSPTSPVSAPSLDPVTSGADARTHIEKQLGSTRAVTCSAFPNFISTSPHHQIPTLVPACQVWLAMRYHAGLTADWHFG